MFAGIFRLLNVYEDFYCMYSFDETKIKVSYFMNEIRGNDSFLFSILSEKLQYAYFWHFHCYNYFTVSWITSSEWPSG